MTESVPLQTVHGQKAFRTIQAGVRPLPRVRAQVHREMPLAGEAFPTVDAGVRRLARVSPIVHVQLPRGKKRLSAGGAQVILLPFMHLHVPHKTVFAEVFAAYVAQVGGAGVEPFVLI